MGAAKPRDPYPEVGRASRAAISAALEAGLTRHELLTLLAVLDRTVTWSRLDEMLTIRQVAACRYGVDERAATRTHTNKTTAALRALAAKGVLVYETSSPGGAHRIGLHPAAVASADGERSRPDPERGAHQDTSYARDEEITRTISEPDPHPAGPAERVGIGTGRDGLAAALVERLVVLCGPEHRRSAAAVVARLGRDFDWRVVDEMVTWAENAEQPTRSPRRLLAMADTWGPQRGVTVTAGFPPPAKELAVPQPAASEDELLGLGQASDEERCEWAPPPPGMFDELRDHLRRVGPAFSRR